MRSTAFSIRGTDEAWPQHWRQMPEPGWHDLFALTKRGAASMEGDLRPLLQNLQYFKDLLALPRAPEAELMAPVLEPMVGRYVRTGDRRRRRTASTSRRPARASRWSACTPPAPTTASTAICWPIPRSRSASACWPSTCRGTASRRRPTAGSAASTG